MAQELKQGDVGAATLCDHDVKEARFRGAAVSVEAVSRGDVKLCFVQVKYLREKYSVHESSSGCGWSVS